MASNKTRFTELATAVGLLYEPECPWPSSIEELTIPGIADEVWKPVIVPATATGNPNRDLLLRALDNGRAFRLQVLRGRPPDSVEWSATSKNVWPSDVPRDLTVDGVYFIQAKYDSNCILNTSPATLVDDLLADGRTSGRLSWFDEVAPQALQHYYVVVRDDLGLTELPRLERDLSKDQRFRLKTAMRERAGAISNREHDAYRELCAAVSEETARRWRRRLDAATDALRTHLLFRMLRIAGGPYWLLGTKGQHPVRLAVNDTRAWRERFSLRKFVVTASKAGQPQVDWRAEILDRRHRERRLVEGYCEIRWSHGKLQGHPECKVQVTTPLDDIPGYDQMAKDHQQSTSCLD
ncbi:MAG: hypothetical protein N2037_02520 [Acidimicrobiales bacterium]|nr:hypothetical protein [Acidimicrobiales bacterium]